MSNSVFEILSQRFNQKEFVSFVNSNLERFDETFKLALLTKKPQSWRAAWVLNHCLKKNDKRTEPYVSELINHIPKVTDGHQRELFKLLEHAPVSDNLEGRLFDVAVTAWEDVSKTPSVRIVAFRVLIKIAAKYPELHNEIEFLTQNQYIESLSPGIKNSLKKQLSKFNKNR